MTFTPSDSPYGSKIIKNEWFGNSKAWDITTESNKIIVKEKEGHTLLEIENNLDGRFILRHIDISYKGIRIITEKIRRKQFGSRLVPKHTAFRILNSRGREISRITTTGPEESSIKWETALDIRCNYMSSDIKNLDIKNSDFYYCINPQSTPNIVGCNIGSGTNLTISKFSKEVKEFIEFVNREESHRHRGWPNETIKKFKDELAFLKHTKLISQFSFEEQLQLREIEVAVI